MKEFPEAKSTPIANAYVLSPEYLVMLLPVNDAFTTLDYLFNFFRVFHPESDCFLL